MEKYEGYNLRSKDALVGVQFLFVAFGALVLVPILTGLDTSVALFTAGIGTLLFQLITRKHVPPIFLASSFAFIAPLSFGVKEWGIAATMSGVIAAGLFYVVLSLLIRLKGEGFLHKILPPVVVGPVIMMFGRGMLRLVPILCGIAAGYCASLFVGIVDFTPILNAPWFALPNFTAPVFKLEAVIYMVPIAIAPAIEHIGDMLAISNVTKENFLKNPGLKSTLLGDGLATSLAGCFGGPPNTTYSEVTGAVSITKAYNPAIMTFAALAAILLAFVGKLGAALSTIPAPVIGGIMLLLFGIIASVGMETLIKNSVDLAEPRNMIIVALIFVCAIGGMVLDFGAMSFSGVGLGAIIGITLNLVLPKTKHFDGY